MRFILSAVVTLFLFGIIGCEPPNERKKFPGYSKAIGPMQRAKFPTLQDGMVSGNCFDQALLPLEETGKSNAISITNADEFIGGAIRSGICVNLPDASHDEHLLGMFETFKTMAIPFLLNQSMQNRNVIIVDLRNNPAIQFKRVDYEVSGPGFSIPVVVKWDMISSGRLMNFLTKAKELPGIQITQMDEEYHF